MILKMPGINIKLLFVFLLFIPELISGQYYRGTVKSSETDLAIAYVNVRISGKNIGTVSNEYGNFNIYLDDVYNNDSLHFSMIGYKSRSLLVNDFKEDPLRNVYLDPVVYNLHEIIVLSRKRKAREIRLGFPVFSDALKSGFADNNLGSELAVKLNVRGRVRLKDINLNVATCTYDSVTYRLNIYQAEDQGEYKNILREPIYLSFTKDKINDVISFDLSKYSIPIKGDVMIALELYKDLGEGRLLFNTGFFTGTTYHRKTSDGTWLEAPGVIGMYLHGDLLK